MCQIDNLLISAKIFLNLRETKNFASPRLCELFAFQNCVLESLRPLLLEKNLKCTL